MSDEFLSPEEDRGVTEVEPSVDMPSAPESISEPTVEQAGNTAVSAARSAQQSIRDGIDAFRNVRAATQRHASAKGELQSMQEELDAHTAVLRHRIDIEERYTQIVSDQTAVIEETQVIAERATTRIDELAAQKTATEGRLAEMKRAHEDQLRPYKNLAESSRGRADDTARALADARRTVKSAEAALNEATKRRDQRISAANRSVDNARERLRTVQAELADAQLDEESPSEALQRLQDELALEQAHLATAQGEVTTAAEEAARDVEEAQQKLFDLRRALAQAEREADAAKREATDRRSEYDSLLKQAQEREKALSIEIRDLTAAGEQAAKDREDAQKRGAAAQAELDEAEEIHATPQQTIDLHEQVTQEQEALSRQQDAVAELAATERDLRKGTFRQRLLLVIGLVAALLVVIGLVVAIVRARSRAKQPDVPETPAATQTVDEATEQDTTAVPEQTETTSDTSATTPTEQGESGADAENPADSPATPTDETATSTDDESAAAPGTGVEMRAGGPTDDADTSDEG